MSQQSRKIKVTCPSCEKTVNAPAKMAGRSGKCPGCGHKITIPVIATSSKNTPAPNSPKKKSDLADLTPPQVVASKNTTQSPPDPAIQSGQSIQKPIADPRSADGPVPENSKFIEWPTLIFWFPFVAFSFLTVLYGVITVIGYSSGPNNMGSFLAKRMTEGAYLILSGLIAYGISAFCIAGFCKRRNLAAKITLYVVCWLGMIGAFFALLVLNQAWYTAWLVVLNLDLMWTTWIFAWTLVALGLGTTIFHALKTRRPSRGTVQASTSEYAMNSVESRKYWRFAISAPVILLLCSSLLWFAQPSSTANRQSPSNQVNQPGTNLSQANRSRRSNAYQPKKVKIIYENGKPKITRFEEAVWIYSDKYTSENPGRDEIAAWEWLSQNKLDKAQGDSLVALVTPFFELTGTSQLNRKFFAFYMIEKYGGPDQVEAVANFGNGSVFPEPRRLLEFVAKHCKDTQSKTVVDYLMNIFDGQNGRMAIDSPDPGERTARTIAEDALVLIGDPVLDYHGDKIRAKDDPDFQRLSMRLKKLAGLDVARHHVNEIEESEKRRAASFAALRGMDLAAADHKEIASLITSKINSYLQKETLQDSGQQDAMISLAAVLTKWGSAEQSLPIIAQAMKHVRINNDYGQNDQQYRDIIAYVGKFNTPAAAEVYVAMLTNLPRAIDRKVVLQGLRKIGNNEKQVIALLNSNRSMDREFANEFIDDFDQALVIKQCFADLSRKNVDRNSAIERIKGMEIEPKNQPLVVSKITELDKMYQLQEVYFKCAGSAQKDELKELVLGNTKTYHLPALNRLMELDPQSTLKFVEENFRIESNRYNLKKAIIASKDEAYEQLLISLLDLSDKRLTRDVVEVLGKTGTAKSVNALKQLASKLGPRDRSLAKNVQSALTSLQSQ